MEFSTLQLQYKNWNTSKYLCLDKNLSYTKIKKNYNIKKIKKKKKKKNKKNNKKI